MLSEYLKNNSKIVLIIKAEYYVIEPYYMWGTNPHQLASKVVEPYCLKLNPTNDIY
jgi:hypothetical protein